jgi:nucleoid DNA-binding protein
LRTATDWRSSSKENYKDFKRKHPSISLSYEQWKGFIYEFNESFKEYILETGDKVKYPFGFGEFAIGKRKRRKFIVVNGQQHITLPIDWKKTMEKGKVIYNFNFHTDGYYFGWHWFKNTARFRNVDLWYFKASRSTSRLLAHYIKVDEKYQHLYKEWYVNKTPIIKDNVN